MAVDENNLRRLAQNAGYFRYDAEQVVRLGDVPMEERANYIKRLKTPGDPLYEAWMDGCAKYEYNTDQILRKAAEGDKETKTAPNLKALELLESRVRGRMNKK